MFDYTELLNDSNANQKNNNTYAIPSKESNEAPTPQLQTQERFEVDRETLSVLLGFINGWDKEGNSKVVITYQNHTVEGGEAIAIDTFHSAEKPAVNMSFDSMNPEWFALDIIFRSHLEPELKLMWGHLQRFKNNCAKNPEKDHVFYMSILARDTVTTNLDGNPDTLFSINIINPVVFYLVPEDTIHTEPNIIRMLIPVSSVEFSYQKNELYEAAKEDVINELSNERFLDSSGGENIE